MICVQIHKFVINSYLPFEKTLDELLQSLKFEHQLKTNSEIINWIEHFFLTLLKSLTPSPPKTVTSFMNDPLPSIDFWKTASKSRNLIFPSSEIPKWEGLTSQRKMGC